MKITEVYEASWLILLITGVLCLSACGPDDVSSSRAPYNDNETAVIVGDDVTISETPDGDACIELEGGMCITPQEECGEDARVDVFLDDDGEVIEIVCYPTQGEATLVETEDGTVSVGDNGAVVILDEEDLGGDLVVEGNRGVIYGDSPEETVIAGNVNLKGNESTVRGVRIQGDAVFEGNNARLLYCVIEGDVIFKGNDNLITNCTVFGEIRGDGNEDEIVANNVQGAITIGGQPARCDDNRAFVDSDDDFVLSDEEFDASTPLDCGS